MRRIARRLALVIGEVVLLIVLTVSAAGGSSPVWSITKPVNSGSQALFTSVSCGSASTAWRWGAGGSRRSEQPVFEQWPSGKWAKTPVPNDPLSVKRAISRSVRARLTTPSWTGTIA